MSSVQTPKVTRDSRETGLSWSRLLRWIAVAMPIALLALMVLAGGIVPFLIVPAVIFAGAAWLHRRKERPGAILLAILLVLFLLGNLPFIIPSLAAPASTADFLPTVIVTLLTIVGAVSAIAVIRGRGSATEGPPRMAAIGAATVLLIAIAVTVFAKITYPDATARPGDITLVTQNFEFSKKIIAADGGRVAVFVDNQDTTLHTFTVEELGVDLEIPAGEPARIRFDAEPGTYEFFCRPHQPDMSGTLEVSS